MKRGKFIVFEGGEGGGKDTQIEYLKRVLTGAVYTRVPGGTALGERLRDIVVHESEGPISILAELFLFLADRAEQVEEVIRPALMEGKTVVSNRSWPSLVAYQICARERYEWQTIVEAVIEKMFEACPIDLMIVLDLPPETGLARLRGRKANLDSIESLPLTVHERVRQSYLDTAKKIPSLVIDASRPEEAVWKDVQKAVASVLN